MEDMRKQLERVSRDCDEKAAIKEVNQFSVQTNKTLEDLQRDMILKSNIKDVCALLDAKSSNGPTDVPLLLLLCD